jgi:hypothetical protein
LTRVGQGTERRVKEREVPCSHASINAGDVFLLDGCPARPRPPCPTRAAAGA